VTDDTGPLLDRRLGDFLDDLESAAPIPASGPAAAIVGAMAASLVVMAARSSTRWDAAPGVAAQAGQLRARLLPLAQADAHAYKEALEALGEVTSGGERHSSLGAKLDRAAALPLAIAEATADIGELAALAAEYGDGPGRTDAIAAAALAEGATVAAIRLVDLNLRTTHGDERSLRGEQLIAAAAGSRERALASG
jgi:formiminotetrahydrofolate cyclodeaminase